MAKKSEKESKQLMVSIRKLKTNYELRYDFSKILTEYIKTLPKEHRAVRVDSVIDVDGKERTEWVRLIREVAMGQIISFLLDNNITFVFQNVPEEDIAKLRLEYIDRQRRLAQILKLKGEQLEISDEPLSFMKIQPHHYQKQAVKFFEINNGISILGDQPGVGKCQPLDSDIFAEEGIVKMGDLKLGQLIFNQNGNLYPVSGIFPQGIQDTYRVTFSDDFSAECNLEHLWTVRGANRRKRGTEWVVKTLKELVDSGLNYNHNKESVRAKSNRQPVLKWEIPITQPVKYSHKDYIIDPYVLGTLIGDGSLTNGHACISTPDFQKKIGDEISKIISDNFILQEKKVSKEWEHLCSQYFIINKNKSEINSYTTEINRLGLNVKSGQKFIPKEYLYGSIDQRISLLQGLMDTDGSSLKNRINFHTTSNKLSNDVCELVQSLGGQAILNICERKEENKPTEYSVSVRIDTCPFRLNEKTKEWNISKRNYTSRYIKSVEFIRKEEHQCIKVDSPDSTYLTNNYIVTHNTCSAFTYAVKNQYKTLVVCPATLKLNWRNEIINFTNEKAFIYKFKPKKKSKTKAFLKEDSLFHIVNYESLESYLKIEYKHSCKGKRLVPGKGMETCGTEIVDLQKKHKECPMCKNQNSFKSRIIGYKSFSDDFDDFIDPSEYDLIVIDEFHRIKEKKTGWTQIIKEAFRDVIPRKLLLSGTAIKSRPSEFFMGLNFLDPQTWNNQHEFGVRYCAGFQDTFGWKYDGASNLEELYERMSPVFLRRQKQDVLKHLPPKTYTNIPLELASDEYKEYSKLLDECVKIIDGKEVKIGYLETILKLKLFLAKCKLKRTIEFIQDIVDSGEKVVIMSDFQEIAEAIHSHFKSVAVLHTGSINDVNKQEAVDRFQNDKKIKIFSGMVIASGVGITLTAASKLMFMGFAWTPGDMIQAEDRIHRASTTHDNIQIITPYFLDTIEEDIMELLNEKSQIVGKVLDNKAVKKDVRQADESMMKTLFSRMGAK